MTTGYDLLIAGDLDVVRLRVALCRINEVPLDEVDVADEDAEDRNWQAIVLCTFAPRSGDIRWALDVYVTEAAPVRRSVAESAEELAVELRVPVLYDAGGVRPSAYWLAAPDGPRTRARVYDGPEEGSLVIDAVERPVALLPRVRVAPQPEVIKDHPVPHPIADAFDAVLGDSALIPVTGDELWHATTRLKAWEALAVRMTTGWPPDGRYPRDFYDQDLEVRDQLTRTVVPAVVAVPFERAVEAVDAVFRDHTTAAGPEPGRGWWWGRVPDPEPWS
ncbi:hypothetical protein GCM10010435_40540 [Winogradskya consettensis]|uniref:Uncharacterized protein n=1 Tax=Winogradskya consettensis TaxID=113560 RepID=A0A919SC73_9ACTN|nr:hypothetical protein [Actinoplanes consettensis]GIM69727.1 hypothetical protein Aco04nite_16670 [Actinoplanes consettensis]